jgi:cytochrome c556
MMFFIGATWLAVSSAMALALAPALTHAADQAEPLALRSIMQDMKRDMQTITGAIAEEDWKTIVELAPKVATHPEPPLGEKMRVMAYLGTDAAKFKGFDAQTHQAAQALETAAKQADGLGAIAAFAKVQSSCLACHQNFRASFVSHFYEQK